MRITLFLAALCLPGCGTTSSRLEGKLQAATQEFSRAFPIGMNVATAREVAQLRYPGHSEYSASKCEETAKYTVPAYEYKGGPCIFGFIKGGHTWWGFQSDLAYCLIFDSSGTLQTAEARQVHTFL